jgi:hypothetical protein
MANATLKLYEALKSAGVPDAPAREATEALMDTATRRDDRLGGLDARVTLLTWMVGVNIALTLMVIGKLYVV